MALTLSTGKPGIVRFEITDGEVTSTVTIDGGDDENAILRKLKRIVALAENQQAADYPKAVRQLLDAKKAEIVTPPMRVSPPQLSEEQVKNGWEMIADGEQ